MTMHDIREYPSAHSVAPSRYSRAGASKLYHSSSPSPGHVFRDDNDDEQERSLAGSPQQSSDPDEAVFEITSQQSSPGTSHHSDDDDMSEFPPDLPTGEDIPEQQHFSSSPYTPHKIRSPFRNPSSVRAMQMDTTPPHLTSSPSQQRYSITAPSRNGTPRSTRSSHSAAIRSPSRHSPVKKLKKEYPLVLLHVTLLPIPIPYSPAVMESVLPHYILENWKLLRQKATQTVLDRGILIPHPKEDYDLLEERLLESLELKTPRILKCGHFYLSPEEEADVAGPYGFDSDEDEDEDADADICDDCGRRIRNGRFGSGAGSKRWDIKLFAANGLMRAGAWGAAWREMERVDVEIVPWMDEELKRQLELRNLEEAESFMPSASNAATVNQRSLGDAVPNPSPGMDEARMREIYGDSIAQPYVVDELDRDDENATGHPPPLSHHQAEQENSQRQQQQPPEQRQEIPLPTLLRNYIYLLVSAQDSRNIAIGFLGFLVLLLTLRAFTTTPPPPPQWTYDATNWHQRETILSDTPSMVTSSAFAPTVSTASTSASASASMSVSASDHLPISASVPTPSIISVDTALVLDDKPNSNSNQEPEPEQQQEPTPELMQDRAWGGNEG